MLAPVVLFVYNRLEHTIKTIKSLEENMLAESTDLFIFSDAAKDTNSENDVAAVREYISSINNSNIFKSIQITYSEVNKGLARSVISGVSDVIDKYGKVIVVEDDLVLSIDFLQYMNDALNYYEEDGRIWSISGYNLPISVPENYKDEVYFAYRGCSWGWATWKNRWELVDWEVSDYFSFKNNKKMRSNFNRGGRDMANMLDLQMSGKIDSWAIRWCYSQSRREMYTVYPVTTRVLNSGLDGSGTHKGLTSKFNSNLNESKQKVTFVDWKVNSDILNRFRDYYMSDSHYIVFLIKNFIKRILLK